MLRAWWESYQHARGAGAAVLAYPVALGLRVFEGVLGASRKWFGRAGNAFGLFGEVSPRVSSPSALDTYT